MLGEDQQLQKSQVGAGSCMTSNPKADNNSDAGTQVKARCPPSSAPKSVPYYRLYSHADRLDVILLVLGCIGAVIHGLALPIFFVVFGDVVDALGTENTSLIPQVTSLLPTVQTS